jgi:hypothetical protein
LRRYAGKKKGTAMKCPQEQKVQPEVEVSQEGMNDAEVTGS